MPAALFNYEMRLGQQECFSLALDAVTEGGSVLPLRQPIEVNETNPDGMIPRPRVNISSNELFDVTPGPDQFIVTPKAPFSKSLGISWYDVAAVPPRYRGVVVNVTVKDPYATKLIITKPGLTTPLAGTTTYITPDNKYLDLIAYPTAMFFGKEMKGYPFNPIRWTLTPGNGCDATFLEMPNADNAEIRVYLGTVMDGTASIVASMQLEDGTYVYSDAFLITLTQTIGFVRPVVDLNPVGQAAQ